MHKKSTYYKVKVFALAMILLFTLFSNSYADENTSDAAMPQDGIYTVNVALWHQVMDKPSMGNKGLVPQAEVQIKDGKATMFLETQIIQVTGITASLVSFFYFDDEKQEFTKAEARVYTHEIDGQKRPRIFIFPINYGQEFSRCKVDPKVEVMGDKPIEARLKVDWESLTKIDKSVKQEIIDQTAQSDIETKVELKQQETAAENAETVSDVPKQKHQLMQVKPVGTSDMNVSNVSADENLNQEAIPEADFTKTVNYGSEKEDGQEETQGTIANTVEPRERKGIIFGVAFFIIILLAISISVIAVYSRKIRRENRRAAELDIFEGDLQI